MKNALTIATEVFIVVLVIGIVFGIAMGMGEASRTDRAQKAVPIGNGIERTDDPERGVSCYRSRANGAALSCVGTGIGLVGDLAQ